MANSKYYKNEYKKYKQEAKNLENNVEQLQKAYNNLNGSFSDEISAVNAEYDDLKEDLKKAIRHNSSFTNSANSLYNKREKGVNSDLKTSATLSYLEDELRSLKQKKQTAETNRDNNKNKYDTEKKKEQAEFWSNLF